MIGVAAGSGCDVDDAAGKAAELGAAVVGLHAKFLDRLGAGRQHDDVAVRGVLQRDAVIKRGALVGKPAAYLVIAGSKHVFARQAALAAALRNDGRRDRDQIEHVPSVERQLLHRSTADNRADRRPCELNGLCNTAQLQRDVDAGCGLDIHLDPIPNGALKSGQLDFEPVGARHKVHERIRPVGAADAFASLVGRSVDERDAGARNDAALRVLHHGHERSVETLAHHRSRQQNSSEGQCGRKPVPHATSSVETDYR